jgi:hypothetical protein
MANKVQYTQTTNNIWFPDQVEPVYDPDDFVSKYQFTEYWKREKDRCINGFDLADGQVHVPGELYFHTVYAKIASYANSTKRKSKQIMTPLLRDIDWDIFKDVQKCKDEGILIYGLVGARDFGKSVIAATLSTWNYTFFDNSETVISGGDEKYIKLAVDKISAQMTYLHPVWRKKRLANDWRKEVRAGWKDKGSTEPNPLSSMSVIWMRNYDDGTNSMAANGTRPSFQLIDEIGTIQNLIGCVKDSDGCWWSGDGDKPSCLVFMAGTGGDMEKGEEAGLMFNNPEGYGMLAFAQEDGSSTGRFISVLRAKMKYKEPKTLAQYLGIDHPDLEKITILVSNEKLCLEDWYLPELKKNQKTGLSKAILKFKAYNPLVPADSFIRLSSNIYNPELSRAQQIRIRANELESVNIELDHDGEKIIHRLSKKLPITEWPIKDQDTDAPIQVWEFPIQNPPWGLYVAGVDPYRYDDSTGIPSMGSVYIYKRTYNVTTEKFQNMFVASYVARPGKKDYWEEQARYLIKYYNALTLCENDVYDFITYMISKGDEMYLQRQPEWIKEFIMHSQVHRDYGLNRSVKTGQYLDGQLKAYMEEIIYKEKDDKGSVIKEILGIQRILDPMLLEETIRYDSSGKFKGKYDRIVAAGNALALANHLDPIMKSVDRSKDTRYQGYGRLKSGNTIFVRNGDSAISSRGYRGSSLFMK